MRRTIVVAVLLALAGCAGMEPYVREPDPCRRGEHTMECQIERYKNVP